MAPTPEKIHATFVHTTEAGHALGCELARLRYDRLVEVLEGLQEETRRMAMADRERGRPKLGALAEDLVAHLAPVVADAKAMATLCQPFIDAEMGLSARGSGP